MRPAARTHHDAGQIIDILRVLLVRKRVLHRVFAMFRVAFGSVFPVSLFLLFLPPLRFGDLFPVAVHGQPLSLDPIQTSNLPPPFAPYDAFELQVGFFLRVTGAGRGGGLAQEMYEHVCCVIA